MPINQRSLITLERSRHVDDAERSSNTFELPKLPPPHLAIPAFVAGVGLMLHIMGPERHAPDRRRDTIGAMLGLQRV